MRLSAILTRLIVFVAVGFLSYAAARTIVTVVEDRSVLAVQETLLDQGYEWAAVRSDGLQVILEGQAPTEAVRFRAVSAAGGMVDASRIIDIFSVADSAVIEPPKFAIEILRNDAGVSLIGLIPATTNRTVLTERISDIADGQSVTDLLDVADYPTPQTWHTALNYSLRALEILNKSKISVMADRVEISAIADSPEEKRRMEVALARNTPDGVRLAIDINAPRPVISPFTVRFVLEDAGPHFDACTADTADARDNILRAAARSGFQERVSCPLALGAPSRTWGEAVALSISAVGDLGGGAVTITDTDVTLRAPAGTGKARFDDIVGRLENALPDAFALTAELAELPTVVDTEAPQFTATLSPEGNVQLRGRVPDDITNTVIKNFAAARFPGRDVTMGTRIVGGLPSGWSARVLTGVEALSALSNGAVIVTPDTMEIRGNTGTEDASGAISRLLIEKLGQSSSFNMDVTYVKELDPIAAMPTPEECIAQITAITEARKITFDPGSADLADATQPVVDDIAEVLKSCGDLPIRVSGYTDSQGREVMNQQLSQDRADAVLNALRARSVPVSTFESIGFGEENPIADNETEEGREANRRIAFSLIASEPVTEETTALDELAAETPLDTSTQEAPATEDENPPHDDPVPESE